MLHAARTPIQDLQNHLLAGSVYISSQMNCAISDGLTGASFWAFVIQDIQVALAYQIPVRLPLDIFDLELRQRWRDSTNLHEEDWIYQTIWLLAKAVDCSYGHGWNGTMEPEWRDIAARLRRWEHKRPNSFRPLYWSSAYQDAGNPFPTIMYSSTGHGE